MPKDRALPKTFDIDNPDLPGWVAEKELTSDGFPYHERLKKKSYKRDLERLQIELVKALAWTRQSGERVCILFEGRDAAGKGGAIKAFRENLNPRYARIVALTAPDDKERGEWYFQRYAAQLPTAGEIVLFDRSWYNRGVVEPVMGFCTKAESERFLDTVPDFERMLVRDGIHLFKFWLNIGRETQLKRFHDRRHDPLKIWKISPVDLKAIDAYDDFTKARDEMIAATHKKTAPWMVVRANDKRRARLELIRHVLLALPYQDKDNGAIGQPDPKIIGAGPAFL